MSLINSLANLAFFPTELLEQILSFISLSDVLQVRLTCKALNQAFSVRVWSSIIVHNHGQKCGLQHSIMYDTWTLKLTSLCPINKFVIKHFMRGRNRSSIAEENYIYKAHLDGIKRLRPLLPGSLSMDVCRTYLLQWACVNNHVLIVETILNSNDCVNRSQERSFNHSIAFVSACTRGHAEVASIFVKMFSKGFNSQLSTSVGGGRQSGRGVGTYNAYENGLLIAVRKGFAHVVSTVLPYVIIDGQTRAGTSGHQPGTHICGIDSRTILLQCRCVVVLSILLEDVRVQPCVVVRNDFVRNGLEDMLKVLITSRPDQAELFLREKSKIHKRLQSSSNAIVID